MDTFRLMANAEASRGQEPKVFDWEKAARLIKNSKATNASAGLSGDWSPTCGVIFENGNPSDGKYAPYLSSTWANPQILIGDCYQDCYRMQSKTPGWDSGTFWPKEALAILKGD